MITVELTMDEAHATADTVRELREAVAVPGALRQVMRVTGIYPMGYTRLRRVPEEKRRIHVQPCRVCSLQEDHLERLRRPR